MKTSEPIWKLNAAILLCEEIRTDNARNEILFKGECIQADKDTNVDEDKIRTCEHIWKLSVVILLCEENIRTCRVL